MENFFTLTRVNGAGKARQTEDDSMPQPTPPVMPEPEPMPTPPPMPEPGPMPMPGCCMNSLAMAYVPVQKWQDLYEPDVALARGTLFAELDKPFVGEEVRFK